MISILICSKKKELLPTLKENIKATIGIDFEIIAIDNSNNNHSIFSAYNQGLKQSKHPYVCFIHEDVLFHTDNWGNKLISHLQNKTVGIIGVAGGRVATKIPAQWSNEGRLINIIQLNNKRKSKLLREPKSPSCISQPAVLLDGVFLSMRRDIFEKISFDETMKGFHGYDYDICLQSQIAGFHNCVVYDILIEHFSKGKKDQKYYKTLISVFKKHQNRLPLFSSDVQHINTTQLHELDIKRLGRLNRRMARTGFTTNEIIENAKYFVNIIDTVEAKKLLRFIHFKLFIQRLFKSPKYLLK